MVCVGPLLAVVAVEALLSAACLPSLVGEVLGVPDMQREVAVLRPVASGQPVLGHRRHGPAAERGALGVPLGSC
eukprot:6382716-Lingulodinium_polyedra.AAC.1